MTIYFNRRYAQIYTDVFVSNKGITTRQLEIIVTD